jgi:hypothetical protein
MKQRRGMDPPGDPPGVLLRGPPMEVVTANLKTLSEPSMITLDADFAPTCYHRTTSVSTSVEADDDDDDAMARTAGRDNTTPNTTRPEYKNEIGVDSFIMLHQEARKKPAPRYEYTKEVNVDSIILMDAPPPLESWRTRAISESKGISMIGEHNIDGEINVDSVIRIEREREREREPERAAHRGVSKPFLLQSIVEEPPPKPKIFGPPSQLDLEINVDSIIRINQQARHAEHADKVAQLHQQQAALQQQESALQQWQQKVAMQQQEHSSLQQNNDTITASQRNELEAISPSWDNTTKDKKSKTKSPQVDGKQKQKIGFFAKLFGGRGKRN